jgi:hypothetical protein
MSFEKRIRDINKAYVERSLKIGGSRMIGAGATINDFYPNKHLGIAVGGARPSQNLTPEEKKERARLSAEKFRNKNKEEQPEQKHITKQVYKNKHNKRIEVIQTIDVKTMDDKPRKLKKTINGGRKAKSVKKGGYSWESFLNDTDTAVQTGAHIGHSLLPLFGLGKKKGKKGGRAEPDYSTGEPVQNLTIQHLRDKKKDIYSPLGVLLSQYTPPEQMRDQSIRPDMPLDQVEVVKPPPPPKPLSEWQAFKKGMMIIPHAIGTRLGGEEPKRKGKKGGSFFHPNFKSIHQRDREEYLKTQNDIADFRDKQLMKKRALEKAKETPTPTPPPVEPVAPVAPAETTPPPTGGKRGKKGGNFLFKKPPPRPKPSEGILTKPKTSFLKDVFKQIIECNLSQIETDIMELNPKDRIDVILKLSEYVLPKLQRSSIEMERENNGLEIVVIRGEKFKDKNNEIEEEYY